MAGLNKMLFSTNYGTGAISKFLKGYKQIHGGGHKKKTILKNKLRKGSHAAFKKDKREFMAGGIRTLQFCRTDYRKKAMGNFS